MLKFLAFAAMAVVWGLTWIAAKNATTVAPPMLVGAVRLVIAAACFLAWSLAARLPLRIDRPARLVASALLINTGCYSFLFWGVARAPSGLAAIVNLSLIPIFSMTIGALYGEERVTRRRIAAIALGSAGLALLFGTRDGGSDGRVVVLGLGAIAVATLCYAWGAIISKPLVRAMPPVALAFWQTTIGGVALMAVAAGMEGIDVAALSSLTRGPALAGIAFLVVFGSLVGFSVYLWLLREWGAFRAGLYAFVSPIIAVSTGILWAGEPFGLVEALGMAILLASAALVIRRDRRPAVAS